MASDHINLNSDSFFAVGKKAEIRRKVQMKHELLIFVTAMLVIWLSLLSFLWVKADEITKNPCSICANRTDSTIVCTKFAFGSIPINKFYYPNGSIIDNRQEIEEMINRESDKMIYGEINFNSANLSS